VVDAHAVHSELRASTYPPMPMLTAIYSQTVVINPSNRRTPSC